MCSESGVVTLCLMIVLKIADEKKVDSSWSVMVLISSFEIALFLCTQAGSTHSSALSEEAPCGRPHIHLKSERAALRSAEAGSTIETSLLYAPE